MTTHHAGNPTKARRPMARLAARSAALTCALVLLGGCNALERLAGVGEGPQLSTISNPTHQSGYKPVSMPMPAPQTAERAPNSLWRAGSRAFFKDLRANQVGDIVTVTINIDDEADLSNTSSRSRTNTESAGIDNLLGYEGALDQILPEAVNPSSLLGLNSNNSNVGTGTIAREEQIELKVAAVVTQLLPNGNLVIQGRQETKVNFEVRELQIAGVIRPQDIGADNTVAYEKIAEARLAYGGRGHISDVQQPRYGAQIVDILMPF